MKKLFRLCILLVLCYNDHGISAQVCDNLNIQFKADIPSACSTMVMTMIHDTKGRPYLYIANKEGGLNVYDISNITSPAFKANIPVSSLASLHVMNLTQDGDYVYLAIGNSFTNPQQGGMAVVDVSNPLQPKVTDICLVPSSTSGAGIVKVEGNYAYLGAMGSGLVIINITDKNDIFISSQFKPDINYPVKNPNADLYNARGMEVKNSIVYLCFDAGGFRIINCTNKTQPYESGRYSNPALHTPLNLPRAYNNIVLDDSLVYIAVDYCGMEILNISDTSRIRLQGWWNPDHCPGNNWFASPIHANEIHYDKSSKIVFISTGKSDMMVVDVSNPSSPDSCSMYGGVGNNIGTWGAGIYQDQIYLSYICTVGIPFASNWTGVKILTYNAKSGLDETRKSPFSIFLNPAGNTLTIRLNSGASGRMGIYNLEGRLMDIINMDGKMQYILSTTAYPAGMYYIISEGMQEIFSAKFSILH